ncbi:uncharacterized protein DUF3563 [Phyllobacterium leguminum]|uniref:Uncharacterized protein DUF3563 n=1 Tax=Phyllobacterium leguminum TaxID=314237 RepID=A0A318SX11_9HYPH|nr:uncharacterized protein DUF3563 [Phyllobacterium leguminum]
MHALQACIGQFRSSSAVHGNVFLTNKLTSAKEYPMIKPIRRFVKALRGRSRDEKEFAYLSEARDLIDLEYRQRQIDRGLLGGR